MKFEVTILGCGSAVPTSKRNSAAQVLNVLERYFLIDCGEGTQHRLRKYNIPYNKINHIFISHLHGDHFFGLIGLLSTFSLQNRKGELHIYSDPRLKEIIDFQIRALNMQMGYPLIFHSLKREQELIYEDKWMTVTSFPLQHRWDAPVCGFLFQEKERERNIIREMTDAWNVPVAFMQYLKQGQDFVAPDGQVVPNKMLTKSAAKPRSYAYMTDTLCREKFAEYVPDVDLLYHEATYGKELTKNAKDTFHSTAEQAASFAKLVRAKKLIIGHFSSRYPDQSVLLPEAQAIFPNTDICEDGKIFEIPLEKN